MSSTLSSISAMYKIRGRQVNSPRYPMNPLTFFLGDCRSVSTRIMVESAFIVVSRSPSPRPSKVWRMWLIPDIFKSIVGVISFGVV